ncbi:MAG: hypothetical protein GX892_03545 [Thermoanaerobacteraceae bacterium]|uniref:Zn-ribbon domain-containing OB-fold protein n=1 Tax=Herbinix luporum TaxID=1679721 RepID=UPI00175C8F8B|nr:zinc ribbon domain-containing protein [Herbinix luporum]NLZ52217.1 hypothetical protein [Thermoanaerobacteraceae bacterium]HHT55976.1 hypothetical protein [Herbinix luporum]
MGVKLEPVVRTFYEELEKGRIMGRRCKRCGAVEFPPVLACNTCSGTDMEWIEISGRAKMTSLIMPSVLSTKPETLDLMPFCLACVEIEEGPAVNALVRGVTKKNRAELLKKMPVPVKAEIIQREGYKTVVFTLVEEK